MEKTMISIQKKTRKELNQIKAREDHRSYDQTINHLIHTAGKGNLQVANKNIISGVCKTPLGNISEVKSSLGESSDKVLDKVQAHTPTKKEVID